VSTRENKSNYFVQSGLKEIALIRKYFNIKGQGDDVKVEREVSPSNIKGFYKEYFASIRPPKLSYDKIFPKPDNLKLRAFYVGQPDVNLLLNLVVRHCLYVDQIVIVDPLIILPNYDVLQRPQVWAQSLINRALCLCALEEWIKQELIVVIPSVFYYHPEINQIISQAPQAFMPLMNEKQESEFEHNLINRILVNELPDSRASVLDSIAKMGRNFREGEKEEFIQQAAEYEAKYPIRFRLSSAYYEQYFSGASKITQMLDMILTVPILLAPIIAEEMGAFLIFEHRLLYELISLNQQPLNLRSDTNQQLALAFQGLDLPFLHNVSLTEALALRRKGYLNSFRVYLRDLWAIISRTDEGTSLDNKIFEFTDKLMAEYNILEKEWDDIRKELRVKAITSGLTIGFTASSAIAFGNINLTTSTMIGASVGLIKEAINGYYGSYDKVREINKKPLSVFLMLKD
jgi:hypothetical protein